MERIAIAPAGIGRPSDSMGAAVALLGDTAAVGAPGTQIVNGLNAGVVDVYRFRDGAWQSEAMLSPPTPVFNQQFGITVALGTDLLVIADWQALYTFERNGADWQQVDQFDALVSRAQIGLSGDTLVAAGGIYVRSGSGWEQQAALVPDGDETFQTMAIDGDLVVAVTSSHSLTSPPWAVYFYSRTGTTWNREARVQLFPGGLAPVHLSISGHTALVSANDGSPQGGVSVRAFDRDDAGNWVDHGILDTGGTLSYDVPVSIEGDRALIGSRSDFTAYTFVRTNGVWSRQQHFNDPTARCFAAVALSGSTALAGCPGSYTDPGGFGTAVFFAIDDAPPAVIARFGQGNAHAGEGFGFLVATSGDTLLANSSVGNYFYERNAAGWAQTGAFPPTPTHFNAASVAIDGDTAAVGYPVQLYPGGTSNVAIYGRTGGTWSLRSLIPGSTADNAVFGAALALQDDLLVVAEMNISSGTCHVYQRSGNTWQPLPDLHAAASAPGDRFCSALSMSGDTLLVGAPSTTIGIENYAGAVYVFQRRGSTWGLQARLLAPLVANNAQFGVSVAIRGDTAVVGSNNDSGTRGEVNVYKRVGSAWSWQATLSPPLDGHAPGDFGFAVALTDTEDRIVATAPYDTGHDPYAGVAYTFAFDGTQWSPTLTLHAAPPFPRTTNDDFGWTAAWAGDDAVIGAPYDGVGGAIYVGGVSEAVFADGFESAP